MQFLNILKTLLTLLPLIIETVRVIEQALPQTGTGAQKLALVRETIQAGFNVATDATVQFESVWPAIQSTVTAVVTLFNSTGIFTKKVE